MITSAHIDQVEQVADHKALVAEVEVDENYEGGATTLQRTTDYRNIETIDTTEWKDTLEEAWERIDQTQIKKKLLNREQCKNQTGEEEMKEFHRILKQMCREAMETLTEQRKHMLQVMEKKNNGNQMEDSSMREKEEEL